MPIQGTDSATYPFWSPDSRHIGFISSGKLKTVEVLAPTPETLVDNLGMTFGGAWNRAGVILFTKNSGPLFRLPASGGQPVPATELDPSRGETAHRFPRFLPDGDHFLFLVVSAKPEASGIYVGSLTSKGARKLVSSPNRADFAEPDLLLFLRESTLMAQRFDPGKLELLGDPFQIATGVTGNQVSGSGGFSVSDNGVLAVRTGGNSGVRQLTWTDATGKANGTVGIPALYENPRLSPDGKRLAAFRQENGADIWISDLERNITTRFTFDPGVDNIPVWSPDGQWIAFSSNRDGGVFNLYRKNARGTGDDELLLKTAGNKLVNDWSSDGRFLVYEEDSPQTKTDLWMVPLSGDRKPTRLLGTPFTEIGAAVSPDGRWMAYTSDESGLRQVYVQTFPPSGRKWPVSNSPVVFGPTMAVGWEAIVLRGKEYAERRRCPAIPRRRIQSERAPRAVFGSHEPSPPHLRCGRPGASISRGVDAAVCDSGSSDCRDGQLDIRSSGRALALSLSHAVQYPMRPPATIAV